MGGISALHGAEVLNQALGSVFEDERVEAVWAVYEGTRGGLRLWLALHRERDATDGGIQLGGSLAEDLTDEEMDGRFVMASFALSAELQRAAATYGAEEGINALDLLMGELGEGGGPATWRSEGRSWTAPTFPEHGATQAVFVYRSGQLPLLWERERGAVARHLAFGIMAA